MTDERLIELFNERSAIIEYESKLKRADAERQAFAELKTWVGIKAIPDKIKSMVKESVNKEMER